MSFPPGTTIQTFTVPVIGDTVIETNEAFLVRIVNANNATIARSPGVCTILDDDFKVTGVEFAGLDVRLSFITQTNQTYRIQRAESLAAPVVWDPVRMAVS